MARGFRWLLLFGVALVLTALLQPFLDRFLERVGWFSAPGNAVDAAVNWIEQVIGVPAFPWVAGITVGLAAGSWVDTVLRRLDGRVPIGRVAKAKAIASTLEYLAMKIDAATRSPYPETGQYPGLFSEVEIAVTKLKEIGVPAPTSAETATPDQSLRRISTWLKFISPLMREGQIDKAQKLVDQLNQPR